MMRVRYQAMQPMKQTWMKTVPWVLLLLVLLSLDRMSGQSSPNVVLVYIDDLGLEIGSL